uniref:Secreted S1 protease protein n=1 Tax=Pristhesancus plagipennis TaxID=1955184 RepID=A0A2K8JV47_PRIPG|nr:secreted S1 protease protein [Pristhesancus plagipennis]
MKMLQIFLFGILSGTLVFAQTVEDIIIPRGQYHDFATPEYPQSSFGWKDGTLEWNFEVDEDARIKVECDDIRMMQRDPWTKECPLVYLSAIDGDGERKICGPSSYNFVHKSNGNRLTIKFVATKHGSALFKCTAKNIGDPTSPEVIKLHPKGRARKIVLNGDQDTPYPYLDKLWLFESPEDVRISFQCYVTLSKKEPLCGIISLTFNDGIDDTEVCDHGNYVWFSQINKAKLRLQLDHWGHGGFECLVQAVTGPHPNEYENVVSVEVDSSEQGVTPGQRQTSCKCGWTNKNLGRVLHGKETRVNEFPWMVHLYVVHVVNDVSWGSSCGASIITPRHVLTAAHCVVAQKIVAKPENVEMILAKHDSDKPTGNETTIHAERVFVKELYLQKGLSYDDIALIFTKEMIDFSTPLVGPICIEPTPYEVINRRIQIMGWGLTENYVSSRYLRKSKTRVIDPVICGGSPWDVCTMTSPSGTCNGDSGGPLVWLDAETNRYSQVSLVSRGGDRCKGKWSISTLVAYYYGWIQDIIKETDSSVGTCHKI